MRREKLILAVITCLGFAPSIVWSQQSLATLYAQGEHTQCIAVADSLLHEDQSNAQAHYFKGVSLLASASLNGAKNSLEKALDYAFPNPVAVHANLLRIEAGLQSTTEVMSRLDTLLKYNFTGLSLLDREEFGYLADDPEFMSDREQINRNANPCLFEGEYKKLDFWIGEWDVYVGGNRTAESYITKSKGGCTLHEDYRTLGGFYGTSYNYYDPVDSLHKQIWIDKFNSSIKFYEINASEHFLELEATQTGGPRTRMTYTYDPIEDVVVQELKSSSDQGQTWTTSFTGIYRRKNVVK